MDIRTSDALQIVQNVAQEYLKSGQANLPDDEAYDDVLEALEHMQKMIRCLKDGKSFFNCDTP